MQLSRVAGAPNDIDSVMDSVDRKTVAGKFTVDEVFFILWWTVTTARVQYLRETMVDVAHRSWKKRK